MKHIVVYVTVSNRTEGEKIARALLKEKLAACVNIVDNVQSFFWWKGAIDSGSESLLIIKTKKATFKALVKEVKAQHSYDVPEIIALPVVDGSGDYLKWIDESLK